MNELLKAFYRIPDGYLNYCRSVGSTAALAVAETTINSAEMERRLRPRHNRTIEEPSISIEEDFTALGEAAILADESNNSTDFNRLAALDEQLKDGDGDVEADSDGNGNRDRDENEDDDGRNKTRTTYDGRPTTKNQLKEDMMTFRHIALPLVYSSLTDTTRMVLGEPLADASDAKHYSYIQQQLQWPIELNVLTRDVDIKQNLSKDSKNERHRYGGRASIMCPSKEMFDFNHDFIDVPSDIDIDEIDSEETNSYKVSKGKASVTFTNILESLIPKNSNNLLGNDAKKDLQDNVLKTSISRFQRELDMVSKWNEKCSIMKEEVIDVLEEFDINTTMKEPFLPVEPFQFSNYQHKIKDKDAIKKREYKVNRKNISKKVSQSIMQLIYDMYEYRQAQLGSNKFAIAAGNTVLNTDSIVKLIYTRHHLEKQKNNNSVELSSVHESTTTDTSSSSSSSSSSYINSSTNTEPQHGANVAIPHIVLKRALKRLDKIRSERQAALGKNRTLF